MELEGYVGLIMLYEETPDVRYIGVNYGFCNLRYIVLWTTCNSNQLPFAVDAYNKEYKVGMRYDQTTKELSGKEET